MQIKPYLARWADNRPMGMFNPAWFRQLADAARELVLDDDIIDRPHQPLIALPAGAGFSARDPVLVVWASQTGAAEAFAEEAVEFLQANGLSACNIPFDTLELSTLESAQQVLFLVSTTYDGDPPDMAEEFSDIAMKQPASLSQLRYGLLALGDRCYPDFCGFGQQLHSWLQTSQARAWFEPIEVDDENEDALNLWRQRIGALLPLASRQGVHSGISHI